MREYFVFGCIGTIAAIFLTWGILVRIGYLRTSYAVRGNPVFAPPALLHSLTFLGLAMGFLAVIPFVPKETRPDLVDYVIIPLWILTLVLAIWQPRWLKPKWLRWLEREHGDIIEVLWKEVREEGHSWGRRVRTQEELEAWVAEVRRKHKL
jgi:hypothetical protein